MEPQPPRSSVALSTAALATAAVVGATTCAPSLGFAL
eukprot:CAMPEP_0178422234 /NCGR_PEP_ID=MMETSP0689_2-20121128/27065_1 /TAXON_ID=160604 /ORGANISM="Amphidinium massartii, Strain CS-259" /LENGTH=36 /DNA_ID= /DNA_START= /DNA_END= /DNA_ORIENTATION=